MKGVNEVNKIVKKAQEINKFQDFIPELEEGETVKLSDVWDGEGDAPEDSYSYLLTDDGEDGESNYDIWINYKFKVVEEKENPLDSVVTITAIELI